MNNSDSSEEFRINKITPGNKKREKLFSEDDALDIVDLEFQDLEEWLRKETKKLKKDSFNIIDCLKVKQQHSGGLNISSLSDDK